MLPAWTLISINAFELKTLNTLNCTQPWFSPFKFNNNLFSCSSILNVNHIICSPKPREIIKLSCFLKSFSVHICSNPLSLSIVHFAFLTFNFPCRKDICKCSMSNVQSCPSASRSDIHLQTFHPSFPVSSLPLIMDKKPSFLLSPVSDELPNGWVIEAVSEWASERKSDRIFPIRSSVELFSSCFIFPFPKQSIWS